MIRQLLSRDWQLYRALPVGRHEARCAHRETDVKEEGEKNSTTTVTTAHHYRYSAIGNAHLVLSRSTSSAHRSFSLANPLVSLRRMG